MSGHRHSPDPLRNHGYTDICSCGLRIHREETGAGWVPDVNEPEDYAEAVAWFNECKARRARDKARIAKLEAERDEVEAMLRLSVAEWGGLRPDPDMPVDDDYYITQLRERVRAERRPV